MLITNLLKKLKKIPYEKVSEIHTFFTSTHVRQICFADTFFLCAFFGNIFNAFEISMKF